MLYSKKVTIEDSSPPSVVRKRFFAVGMAAAGCHAHSKKDASPLAASHPLLASAVAVTLQQKRRA